MPTLSHDQSELVDEDAEDVEGNLDGELTDTELYDAETGYSWCPEPEDFEDFSFFKEPPKKAFEIPAILPTQFTEFAFRMPRPDGMGYAPFSFDGRRHMRRVYDTPARRILLFCGRQVEKCCVVSTRISLADGSLREAGEITVGDQVCAMQDADDATMTSAPVTWISGRYRKPCVRITSRQGHVVEVALTHPMRRFGEWVAAGQLVVGDRLAVVRRAGEFGTEAVLKERIRLTAYMIGDGGMSQKQLRFTSLPGAKLDEFLTDVASTGGSYTMRAKERTFDIAIHQTCPLYEWLAEDGLRGLTSAEKFVPSWVFRLSKEDTALFLNRLWSTDGHVKKNAETKYSIEYCSISERLVRQVQALLWKFGIPSKIRENWLSLYKKRGVRKLAYILRVETQQGVGSFLEEIGALGKSAHVAVDPVLVQKLAHYVDSDVYWDEIVRIEDIGEQECVDFEVKQHHNFVADGFITHNSTLLGNRIIAYSCMVQGFRTLYVSPSATQTKTFSTDRIKEPLETSDVLKAYTTTLLQQNVFEKQFVNRSKITLRYAFLNADRARGIPAWCLAIDEFQDILSDNIPVIEQATSHAPEQWRRFLYAGTPKGLDNVIEYYRSGTSKGRPMSTMTEWVVPCDRCGSSGGAGRFWNILGEKNIQRRGLSCERCGHIINPMHEDAQWAVLQEEGIFESYRIPQLMVPWRSWDEIMLDYGRYDRAKFYNEVLGVSYDSGLRPLTRQQVKDCCQPDLSMHPEDLEKYHHIGAGQPIFAGLDWGCHDEQTRILTERGFVYFRDLLDSDRVAQWDPDTREMTFVVPKARTVREWNRPLLHFKTRGGLDLMVTDTHRMRVTVAGSTQWSTESAGETAQRGGNARFVGYGTWTGVEKETFTLPGVPKSAGYSGSDAVTYAMDDWLELLGYLITEAGVCGTRTRSTCVKMSQRETVNPETHARMQSCLDRMRIPYSRFPNAATGDVNWTIYGKQFWSWYLAHIGGVSDTKRIPREFLQLCPRQLRILFDALVRGDGYRDPREGCTSGAFYSTSKGLCEDFQELCIRLGLRCVVRLHKPAEGARKTRWRAMWSEGRDYQFNTPSTSVEHVPYEGKVYCCAVPSGYIVTERDGCISWQGNTGENSYTVLTLGTYVEQRFRIFYIHRFTGEDTDPVPQLAKIDEMLHYFNVRLIGSDYGGGFDRNDHLTRKFGPKRLHKYQYMARSKKKVVWNPQFRRWQVTRTEVMSDLFNAIKRRQIDFPRWEEFEDPYGNDMLNIHSEYNNTLRMLQYTHRPDRPDDSFHSILYCFLVSMILIPRPDIISPSREMENQGPLRTGYRGPIDQG